MDQYDRIQQLIIENSDIAEFATFGDGVSEEWIRRAESALGFKLPMSYKWWLRNYGGGDIGGEEIFSVYGEEFDTVVGGDIVFMYRQQHENAAGFVPICHSDIDGVFSFDRSAGEGAEWPVISQGTGKVYANTFLEFLEKRIRVFQVE
jgi:hypothetical protein